MEENKPRLSELLWTEKYRPKKVKDVILPKRLQNIFSEDGIGYNYLFGGPAGTGKTTLAKALAAGRSILYIDGSTERGIDIVRTKIIDFASTNSMMSSKKKVIILDEMDKFTKDAQDSLKATMETYHQNVFFICTANNPERLIAPLHSRLTFVNFSFTQEEEKEQKKQYIDRIRMILKNEGNLTIANDAIVYLIKEVYPDMRKIIKLLYSASQSLSKGQTQITLDLLQKNNIEITDSLYDFLLTEYREEKIYEFVKANYSGKEIQTLIGLGGPFLEFIYKQEAHKAKILSCAMITHKYNFEVTTGSIDAMITLLACCGALSNILR
jgi:DNA polymerase III delta prime subunit